MSEQSSPPDSRVQSAIINTSCRSWRALFCRGATTPAKQTTNSSTGRPHRCIARRDSSHTPPPPKPPLKRPRHMRKPRSSTSSALTDEVPRSKPRNMCPPPGGGSAERRLDLGRARQVGAAARAGDAGRGGGVAQRVLQRGRRERGQCLLAQQPALPQTRE